jgi:hypothetical protein
VDDFLAPVDSPDQILQSGSYRSLAKNFLARQASLECVFSYILSSITEIGIFPLDRNERSGWPFGEFLFLSPWWQFPLGLLSATLPLSLDSLISAKLERYAYLKIRPLSLWCYSGVRTIIKGVYFLW